MARKNSGRFVISCFPQPVQLDPHFPEKTWQTLEHAINEINKRNISNLSFEQLYRYSYNMVLHKHGDYLYNGLTRLQTDHLNSVADIIKRTEPPAFLAEIKRQWTWFEISLSHVREVLMYMDRHYVKPKKKKNVHELGLALFRDEIVHHPSILPRLSETLLESIDKERNGESIDSLLVKSVTRMLAELGRDDAGKSVYETVFEDGFLKRTGQFYAREATLYLSETTCSEYLRKANQRINEERMRVECYLELETAPRVRRVAETELISKYMNKLINMENSGLIWMLRNDKVEDLKLMYTLFKGVKDGEEEVRSHLKQEVLERGNEIIQDPGNIRDPIALINAILTLREKYDRITNNAFTTASEKSPPSSSNYEALAKVLNESQGRNSLDTVYSRQNGGSKNDALGGIQSRGEIVPDKRFVSAVNDAFERFVNGFNRVAEYLSLYVDKLLRKDFKGLSDDEVESKLEAVMALFRYLSDKDVFERYYKQHLQKRLLYSRSTCSDAERSFITKMKTDCGYLYTSKMEIMFNDMKTSDESTSQFREKVVQEAIDMRGIDLRVFVLTTMSWPVPQVPVVNLPEDAVHCSSKFEEFYYHKHDGRRLTWQQSLGTAEIRATFGTRVYDLYSVSAYAMCILLLFNDNDSLTYKEIADATLISESELIRHLQSLSLAKHKVLKKEPREKEVKPDDKFIFNADFQSRSRRIKMQVVTAKKENEAERNHTRCRINADRGPVIDTVVVRIMKHRKTLEHNRLIAEVTRELEPKFEPNTQEIKKRIESLVEREYLERQKDKRQVYQYVA
ncbi:unnamed protein product [Agarophyton chilense]|eukprot:gb/GEZJ01000093.1/.p1 GENE.gb/GEZJ01000093.1/~~gb/GEZJ01000093.1/.p1  ORF type:complete len:795 (-),score=113.00 gb/GEZJ01000093.1/:2858-5242(-)